MAFSDRDRAFGAGERSFGIWCSILDSGAAEILGASGFDWCCVDMQHGLGSDVNLVPLLQALDVTGTRAFVRPAWNQAPSIMKALDCGARGIIVPMVNSAAEAQAASAACRYPPDGFRSWGPSRELMRSPHLSPGRSNDEVTCLVMIETAEAVEQLDDILAVPGVDGVFVGPSDLAISIGVDPHEMLASPEHARLIGRILTRCQAREVITGIYCGSTEKALRWRDLGFQMLAVASDIELLGSAAAGALQAVRPAMAPQ
jgi:4-hydroxy-2-oxoheptanedioate aldolase